MYNHDLGSRFVAIVNIAPRFVLQVEQKGIFKCGLERKYSIMGTTQ